MRIALKPESRSEDFLPFTLSFFFAAVQTHEYKSPDEREGDSDSDPDSYAHCGVVLFFVFAAGCFGFLGRGFCALGRWLGRVL
jgi:hypothetical protein